MDDTQKKITITPVSGVAPVYHRYSDKSWPQSAYIGLDADNGELYADWYGPLGGIPGRLHESTIIAWEIRPRLNAACINAAMERISLMAERIIDGYRYDDRWHRGIYTDDAEAAIREADEALRWLGNDPSDLDTPVEE